MSNTIVESDDIFPTTLENGSTLQICGSPVVVENFIGGGNVSDVYLLRAGDDAVILKILRSDANDVPLEEDRTLIDKGQSDEASIIARFNEEEGLNIESTDTLSQRIQKAKNTASNRRIVALLTQGVTLGSDGENRPYAVYELAPPEFKVDSNNEKTNMLVFDRLAHTMQWCWKQGVTLHDFEPNTKGDRIRFDPAEPDRFQIIDFNISGDLNSQNELRYDYFNFVGHAFNLLSNGAVQPDFNVSASVRLHPFILFDRYIQQLSGQDKQLATLLVEFGKNLTGGPLHDAKMLNHLPAIVDIVSALKLQQFEYKDQQANILSIMDDLSVSPNARAIVANIVLDVVEKQRQAINSGDRRVLDQSANIERAESDNFSLQIVNAKQAFQMGFIEQSKDLFQKLLSESVIKESSWSGHIVRSMITCLSAKKEYSETDKNAIIAISRLHGESMETELKALETNSSELLQLPAVVQLLEDAKIILFAKHITHHDVDFYHSDTFLQLAEARRLLQARKPEQLQIITNMPDISVEVMREQYSDFTQSEQLIDPYIQKITAKYQGILMNLGYPDDFIPTEIRSKVGLWMGHVFSVVQSFYEAHLDELKNGDKELLSIIESMKYLTPSGRMDRKLPVRIEKYLQNIRCWQYPEVIQLFAEAYVLSTGKPFDIVPPDPKEAVQIPEYLQSTQQIIQDYIQQYTDQLGIQFEQISSHPDLETIARLHLHSHEQLGIFLKKKDANFIRTLFLESKLHAGLKAGEGKISNPLQYFSHTLSSAVSGYLRTEGSVEIRNAILVELLHFTRDLYLFMNDREEIITEFNDLYELPIDEKKIQRRMQLENEIFYQYMKY